MNGSALLAGVRRCCEALVASPRRAALAWAGATFLALAALAGGPGVSRDEAAVLVRADAALHVASEDSFSDAPAPPLASRAAAATRAILAPLGISYLRSVRLGTVLFGALLSAALALLAWETSGPAAALLAPALFWAAPRNLHAGLVATPDLALAALATATVVAWRRAESAPGPRLRAGAAMTAGVLFGAALAARTDAWVLFAALGVHAAIARALRKRPPRGTLERALRGIPPGLAAMAALGPLVLVAAWPSLLRLGPSALLRGGPRTLIEPVAVTALTVPATLLLAFAAGVGLALLHLAGAARRPASANPADDDALLLLCAAAPFAAAAAGIVPAAAGIRPWLHAMPFLALLGARALLAACRSAWPSRAAPLAASLALAVLWPGVRASAHFYPAGSSAWNELAGGTPGAATLGLPRQDGGEAAAAALGTLNARAREGARVFWGSAAPAAIRALARDGRLRSDLHSAAGPDDADIAIMPLDGGNRDAEYRTWSAFRTARPVAGAYLDEVPLVLVYARPGAWR